MLSVYEWARFRKNEVDAEKYSSLQRARALLLLWLMLEVYIS